MIFWIHRDVLDISRFFAVYRSMPSTAEFLSSIQAVTEVADSFVPGGLTWALDGQSFEKSTIPIAQLPVCRPAIAVSQPPSIFKPGTGRGFPKMRRPWNKLELQRRGSYGPGMS